MPDAVPADAAHRLPSARMIDPRGHRFGAGICSALLVAAWWADLPVAVVVALATIGASAAFGLRWSIYGAAWRRIAAALRLPGAEPEHEYPPRFAQTLGSTALTVTLGAFVVGAPVVGWTLVLGVATLQGVLAATGFCLGCRLYFLRWWLPAVATRAWSRGRAPTVGAASARISYR